MKRIMSLLIVLFMVVSLALPFSTNNTTKEGKEVLLKPIALSEITYEIQTVEVEPIPSPDPYEVAIQNIQAEMDEIESIGDIKEWYIAYRNIVCKYAKWIDPPETVYDYFTEEEVRLICKAVETECYQQDFESKCNVASTIFNRYESDEFGETIEEIITSPNQFAYGRDVITEDTIWAVMFVWEIEDTTDSALYFHSNEKTDTFNGASYLFTDSCGHHFYK